MHRTCSYAVLFLFFLCSRLFSEEAVPLHPFKDVITGKYGYINSEGSVVIPPAFCEAGIFRGGIARICYGSGNCDGSAYVNSRGKTLYSSPDFTKKFGRRGVACEFSDGLARVSTFAPNGIDLWGFINCSGRFAIRPKYEAATDFHEGYAAACYYTGNKRKIIIIDKEGKEYDILRNIVGDANINDDDSIGKFSEGLLAVKCANSKWGFIDIKGNVVLRPRYNSTLSDSNGSHIAPFFYNGRAFVEMADDSGAVNPCIINRQGVVAKQLNGASIINFSEGIAFMVTRSHLPSSAIDSDSNTVFQTNEDKRFGYFSEGLCWFKSESGAKCGYIDKTGNTVIELSGCAALGPFINGLATVGKENGESMYINRSGKVIFEQ